MHSRHSNTLPSPSPFISPMQDQHTTSSNPINTARILKDERTCILDEVTLLFKTTPDLFPLTIFSLITSITILTCYILNDMYTGSVPVYFAAMSGAYTMVMYWLLATINPGSKTPLGTPLPFEALPSINTTPLSLIPHNTIVPAVLQQPSVIQQQQSLQTMPQQQFQEPQQQQQFQEPQQQQQQPLSQQQQQQPLSQQSSQQHPTHQSPNQRLDLSHVLGTDSTNVNSLDQYGNKNTDHYDYGNKNTSFGNKNTSFGNFGTNNINTTTTNTNMNHIPPPTHLNDDKTITSFTPQSNQGNNINQSYSYNNFGNFGSNGQNYQNNGQNGQNYSQNGPQVTVKGPFSDHLNQNRPLPPPPTLPSFNTMGGQHGVPSFEPNTQNGIQNGQNGQNGHNVLNFSPNNTTTHSPPPHHSSFSPPNQQNTRNNGQLTQATPTKASSLALMTSTMHLLPQSTLLPNFTHQPFFQQNNPNKDQFSTNNIGNNNGNRLVPVNSQNANNNNANGNNNNNFNQQNNQNGQNNQNNQNGPNFSSLLIQPNDPQSSIPSHGLTLIPTTTTSTQSHFPSNQSIQLQNYTQSYTSPISITSLYSSSSCQQCALTALPPRTFHCSYCRKCFHMRHHHCFFLNTCITKKTGPLYLHFLLLLLFQSLAVMAVTLYYYVMYEPHHNVPSPNIQTNFIIFAFITLSCLFIFYFTTQLLSQYALSLSINMTWAERDLIRKWAKQSVNTNPNNPNNNQNNCQPSPYTLDLALRPSPYPNDTLTEGGDGNNDINTYNSNNNNNTIFANNNNNTNETNYQHVMSQSSQHHGDISHNYNLPSSLLVAQQSSGNATLFSNSNNNNSTLSSSNISSSSSALTEQQLHLTVKHRLEFQRHWYGALMAFFDINMGYLYNKPMYSIIFIALFPSLVNSNGDDNEHDERSNDRNNQKKNQNNQNKIQHSNNHFNQYHTNTNNSTLSIGNTDEAYCNLFPNLLPTGLLNTQNFMGSIKGLFLHWRNVFLYHFKWFLPLFVKIAVAPISILFYRAIVLTDDIMALSDDFI